MKPTEVPGINTRQVNLIADLIDAVNSMIDNALPANKSHYDPVTREVIKRLTGGDIDAEIEKALNPIIRKYRALLEDNIRDAVRVTTLASLNTKQENGHWK